MKKGLCLTAVSIRDRTRSGLAAGRRVSSQTFSIPAAIGIAVQDYMAALSDQDLEDLAAQLKAQTGQLVSGGEAAFRLEAVDPVAVWLMEGDVRTEDFYTEPCIVWPDDEQLFEGLYGEIGVSVANIGVGILLDTSAAPRPHWQTLNKLKGRKHGATSRQHQAGTSHRSHR